MFAEKRALSWHDGILERKEFKVEPMSFQAYLDKVEEITGKAPREFVAEAKKKNLTADVTQPGEQAARN